MPSKSGYEQLKQHEGFISKVKTDRTEKGKRLRNKVIGYGYNITANNDPEKDLIEAGVLKEDVQGILNGEKEITKEQANVLFDISVRRAARDAHAVVSNFESLDRRVQDVLVNMAYQMGRDGLRGFKKMRTALLRDDYSGAAKEILNSKFARDDTPKRAESLAKTLVEYDKEFKANQEAKKMIKTSADYFRQEMVGRLSKVYNRQMLADRLAKGITTMTKNTTEEGKENAPAS